MATTNVENNDQNNYLDPEQQLAVTKEKNRHDEEMARINACNSQEDRKIDLDERRVILQEKETEARIAADKAENDSALAVRKTGMALLGQLVGIAEKFLELKLRQEETRFNYNKAYDAFRSGADVEIGDIKLTHPVTSTSTDTTAGKTLQGQPFSK